MATNNQRRVTFVEELDEVKSPLVLTEELLHAKWYSSEDFERFRMVNKMLASNIRRRHSASSNCQLSFPNALGVIYDSCVRGCAPEEEALNDLAAWLMVGPSRRGLEPMSDRLILRDRKIRSRLAILKVINAQGLHHDEDPNTQSERIRKAYEECTTPARLFGIALAKAADLAHHSQERLKGLIKRKSTLHKVASRHHPSQRQFPQWWRYQDRQPTMS